MGMKKIKKKLQSLLDQAYWKGWNDGWDNCNSDGSSYEEGWAARGENVKTRLKMLEEGYMTEGKGTKAVMVREIAELIAIEIGFDDPDDLDEEF